MRSRELDDWFVIATFISSITILFIFFIGYIIYYNTTKFNKEIIVKDKYMTTTFHPDNGSTFLYFVVSTDNITYELTNLWWKFKFNETINFGILDKGSKYYVKGYGVTIPFMKINPQIYDIEAA